MDFNNLLDISLSTMMKHKLVLDSIFKNKVYKLTNYADEKLFNYFILSLSAEPDLYREPESESSILYYSPFISYPDQTKTTVIIKDNLGKESSVSLEDFKFSIKSFDKQEISILIDRDGTENHLSYYDDDQIYTSVLNDNWKAVEFSIRQSHKASQTKGELNSYFSKIALVNKVLGTDGLLEFTYNEKNVLKNKYNQDITLVVFLNYYLKLTKKYDYDEFISIFHDYQSHLKFVEDYLRGDELDMVYVLNNINKTFLAEV